jgi:hypothetical protein
LHQFPFKPQDITFSGHGNAPSLVPWSLPLGSGLNVLVSQGLGSGRDSDRRHVTVMEDTASHTQPLYLDLTVRPTPSYFF